MTTVAFCSVSSTRGRIKIPLSFRPFNSPVKKACSLSIKFLSSALKRQNDFTTLTRFHNLHRLVQLLKWECMSNHLFEIQLIVSQDATRAIPGIKEEPPGDALHSRSFEDNVVRKIQLDHTRGDAKHRDSATIA